MIGFKTLRIACCRYFVTTSAHETKGIAQECAVQEPRERVLYFSKLGYYPVYICRHRNGRLLANVASAFHLPPAAHTNTNTPLWTHQATTTAMVWKTTDDSKKRSVIELPNDARFDDSSDGRELYRCRRHATNAICPAEERKVGRRDWGSRPSSTERVGGPRVLYFE